MSQSTPSTPASPPSAPPLPPPLPPEEATTGRVVQWSLLFAGAALLAVAGIVLQLSLARAAPAELWSALATLGVLIVHLVGLGLGVASVVGWLGRGFLLASIAALLANLIGLALLIW